MLNALLSLILVANGFTIKKKKYINHTYSKNSFGNQIDKRFVKIADAVILFTYHIYVERFLDLLERMLQRQLSNRKTVLDFILHQTKLQSCLPPYCTLRNDESTDSCNNALFFYQKTACNSIHSPFPWIQTFKPHTIRILYIFHFILTSSFLETHSKRRLPTKQGTMRSELRHLHEDKWKERKEMDQIAQICACSFRAKRWLATIITFPLLGPLLYYWQTKRMRMDENHSKLWVCWMTWSGRPASYKFKFSPHSVYSLRTFYPCGWLPIWFSFHSTFSMIRISVYTKKVR